MNIITIAVACFSVLGAIDYLLGNKFGMGKEFERGFMLMGTMALSMIGMLVLAPSIAELLRPALAFLSDNTPFDPSIIAGSLLANDMGGAPLSMSFARTPESGYFNGLVVSSMMGATISFTLPLALGVTEKRQHRLVLLGIMCGIIAIPVGCLVAGLMLKLPGSELLVNLLPLAVFAAVISVGLLTVPDVCLKIFTVFGKIIKIIIIVGLSAGILGFLLDIHLIPHSAPVEEGVLIVFNASAVMTGAFPLLHVVGQLIKKPLAAFGKALGVNETSALGFVASLATNVTTFSMMEKMDDKGAVLNSAFAVSGAFTFAGHLAFTLSFNADYLPSVIAGKLIAGVAAVIVANIVYRIVGKKMSA